MKSKIHEHVKNNRNIVSRKLNLLIITTFVAFSVTSCFEDRDDNAIAVSEINDFVWKGMNTFYVYKDFVFDENNSTFATNDEYATYLNSFSTPEDLFESLIYMPNNIDEFSVITPNFFELEQQLQGIRLDNGMSFGLGTFSDTNSVFGVVRYVLPSSSAASNGVVRGMIFTGVDGTSLTTSNLTDLLFSNNISYTINLADYNDNGTPNDTSDDSIIPNNNSILLTKEVITENPILINEVIETQGFNIGYLMYNGFRITDASVTELNDIIGNFKSQNIDELVLDLRYNGGGSVSTTIWLASMLAGQFEGQLFFKEQWNNDIQELLEADSPDAIINNFVANAEKRDSNGNVTFNLPLNNLNLSKIYVLTTRSTASASELLINGLRPYIEVVQIGTDTRGKPQASTTIYDSADFTRNNVNPSHTYAIQPLIYESANADGFSQYYDGLAPNVGFELSENIGNFGVLGNENEPLLERAIQDITGSGRFFNDGTNSKFEFIPQEEYMSKHSQEMYDNRKRIDLK